MTYSLFVRFIVLVDAAAVKGGVDAVVRRL